MLIRECSFNYARWLCWIDPLPKGSVSPEFFNVDLHTKLKHFYGVNTDYLDNGYPYACCMALLLIEYEILISIYSI